MCIYIFIYVYANTCLSTYIYTYLSIYLSIYIYIYIYIYICICMYSMIHAQSRAAGLPADSLSLLVYEVISIRRYKTYTNFTSTQR